MTVLVITLTVASVLQTIVLAIVIYVARGEQVATA